MRHFHEKQIFPWNTNIFIKHFHETHIFPWNTNIFMKHFHETEIFPWNTNIFMKHVHETQIFPWKHKYFHETFPWNKNLSVKYNIIWFEAKIPNRENPRLYFIMWIPKTLITHSCEEGIDPQLCQHSFASRYNQDVHINCQYHPDHCWQGWFCFRALPMIKTKSFLQVPWKYIFRYPPG